MESDPNLSGPLPPMSEVAGRMAVQAGAAHMEKFKDGMGAKVTYEAVAKTLGYAYVNADDLLR